MFKTVKISTDTLTYINGFLDSKNVAFKNGVLIRITDKSSWSKVFQHGLSLETPTIFLESEKNVFTLQLDKKSQIIQNNTLIEYKCDTRFIKNTKNKHFNKDENNYKYNFKNKSYKSIKKIIKEKRCKEYKFKPKNFKQNLSFIMDDLPSPEFYCSCCLCSHNKSNNKLEYYCMYQDSYFDTIYLYRKNNKCDVCHRINISLSHHDSLYVEKGLMLCLNCSIRLCCPFCQIENNGGVCNLCDLIFYDIYQVW